MDVPTIPQNVLKSIQDLYFFPHNSKQLTNRIFSKYLYFHSIVVFLPNLLILHNFCFIPNY